MAVSAIPGIPHAYLSRRLCRPLAGLLSWLLPTARIAKTERNDLYPHIQAFFDQGEHHLRAVPMTRVLPHQCWLKYRIYCSSVCSLLSHCLYIPYERVKALLAIVNISTGHAAVCSSSCFMPSLLITNYVQTLRLGRNGQEPGTRISI